MHRLIYKSYVTSETVMSEKCVARRSTEAMEETATNEQEEEYQRDLKRLV